MPDRRTAGRAAEAVTVPADAAPVDAARADAVPPLAELFPFPLDGFQLEAIDALNQGHSVVVSAPTGSGKTLVGEYAIHRALAHGQKVFYTTPLKALSNQKLRDFREQFGDERVGLLTGDLSLNREAQVVVMTTEIFRNMLYAEIDHPDDDPLADVEAVVLDECHYMNDTQRGTVWEESIIHCPSRVQLVALSATVANAGQLTDWIERVHGPTRLIHSDFRPVPLAFSFCSAKGLHPLLNDEGTGLHPNCKVWRPPNPPAARGPRYRGRPSRRRRRSASWWPRWRSGRCCRPSTSSSAAATATARCATWPRCAWWMPASRRGSARGWRPSWR